MPDGASDENLSTSFRQSRKELWFMLAAWIAFACWTVGYNARAAFSEEGAELPLLWGMPRWVVLGIVLPWIAGLVLTVWFSLRFMRDTDLDPEGGQPESGPVETLSGEGKEENR